MSCQATVRVHIAATFLSKAGKFLCPAVRLGFMTSIRLHNNWLREETLTIASISG